MEKPAQERQAAAFSRIIHVDTINTHNKPGKTILVITDEDQTLSTSTIISDDKPESMISAIWNYWCKPYGFPETIYFGQGKVQTSKLEKMLNDLAPLEQKISCRSRKDTFNTEIEKLWQQNKHEISEEEFVHTFNFFCNLQNPANGKQFNDYEDLTKGKVEEADEDEYNFESNFEDLLTMDNDQPIYPRKRKSVSLC
jgi:hypothetical protein